MYVTSTAEQNTDVTEVVFALICSTDPIAHPYARYQKLKSETLIFRPSHKVKLSGLKLPDFVDSLCESRDQGHEVQESGRPRIYSGKEIR